MKRLVALSEGLLKRDVSDDSARTRHTHTHTYGTTQGMAHGEKFALSALTYTFSSRHEGEGDQTGCRKGLRVSRTTGNAINKIIEDFLDGHAGGRE